MTTFELQQGDPLFMKWWKKIKTDQKDPWVKLTKYLQATSYFVAISEQFWTTMSVNPTSWSAQKIITYLTTMGDWIRSGKQSKLSISKFTLI